MLFNYYDAGLRNKPTDARPFQLASNYKVKDATVKEIAELCGNGIAWRAAIYKNGADSVKKVNAIGSYIISLDFDCCEKDPHEVQEFAVSKGLPANLCYWTFSHGIKPNNNFRMMWVLDEMLTPREYEDVVAGMMHIFADFGPDKACKDISRLWYGGNKGSEVFDETPFSAKEIKKNTEISVPFPYKYYMESVPKKETYEIADAPAAKVTVDTKWHEQLKDYCRLWKRWTEGEYLDYNERLTLWTNLKYIKYNTKRHSIVKDIMSYANEETYAEHSFSREEVNSKFRQKDLSPYAIVFYKNKWMTVPQFFDEYQPVSYNKLDKVTLDELDRFLDTEMPRILNSKDIEYVEAQTASGKTERIIRNYADLARADLLGKQIYAVPTHNLAEEFEERLTAYDSRIPVYRIKEREITEKDKILLNLGLPAESKDKERSESVKKLFDDATHGVFIVTHSLLINLADKIEASRIIIDENIEEALLKEVKVSPIEMANVSVYLDGETLRKWNRMTEEVRGMSYGNEVDKEVFIEVLEALIPQVKENYEEMARVLPQKFFNIVNADSIKVDKDNGVRAFYKSKLITHAMDSRTPIKFFTATPMNCLLNAYFNCDIKVTKAPIAMNTGKVIQHTNITGARDKQETYPAKVKERLTPEQIRNAITITFKGGYSYYDSSEFHIAVKNDKEIHLMNNAGLDMFKGKDVIVIGKFDKNPAFYESIWSDIGDGTEFKPNDRGWYEIEENGFKQRLFLFNNETIRKIQFQYINYATAQTIGRARALRTNANVFVFSDFVTSDVDVVYH